MRLIAIDMKILATYSVQSITSHHCEAITVIPSHQNWETRKKWKCMSQPTLVSAGDIMRGGTYLVSRSMKHMNLSVCTHLTSNSCTQYGDLGVLGR